MMLVPLAIALTALAAASLGSGAFVGTLAAVDGASLSVRAESGEQVAFLLDRRTDMPAGFVTGTQVLVRFEVLEGRRYRAVSVSPPRIPIEAGVLTALPSPGPATGPARALPLASAEGDPFFKTVADPEPVQAESIRESVPSVALAVADAWVPPAPLASSPAAAAAPKPLAAAEGTVEDRSPAQRLRTGLLAAMAILLATSAVLAWLAFRLR